MKCENCVLKNNIKKCDIAKPYKCTDGWVNKVFNMKDSQVMAIWFSMKECKKIS